MESSSEPPTSPFVLEDLVGTTLAGRFRILRLGSQGSTMALYDAADDESGRVVTLKLIRPKLAAPPSFRELFHERMRAAAALSHPNIAAVYDWGITPVGDVSTAYVVVEQLTGGSLRDMFDRGRQLTPSQALAVGLDACRGLDYAHRRGLIHGELTPSKLVFGDDRRLRIIDFGLARLLGERLWVRPESVSTHIAWYAAPEQADTSADAPPLDGKVDVYALGLTLHEAVSGTLPFKADSTVATLSARAGKLMPVSADLGPLASVLERAGRPDAHDRSSAAEFGKALVGAASKLPRPEPLPLFATGLFEIPEADLRAPDDPTGGVHRPPASQAPTEPLIVIPADEPLADELQADGLAADGLSADDGSETLPGTAEIAVPAVAVPNVPVPNVPVPAAGTPAAAASAPVVIEAPTPVPVPVPSHSPAHMAAQPPAAIAPGDLVILPLDAGIRDEAMPSASAPATQPVGPRSVTTTAQMPVTRPPAVKRQRRFPWKMLLGLLIVACLVGLGVLATQLFRTPSYVVPNLVGQPEAEARNVIAANGWVVSITQERSDEVSVAGQVVRTVPVAGVELAEAEPFLMVVSLGPTLRPLPDSTNLLVSEAQTALVDIGMVPSVVEQFHEVIEPGVVVSWSVPGQPTLTTGAEVLPETPVELVVSVGPAPRIVPDVVRWQQADAVTELESIQLTMSVASQEFSDDVPPGAIISQTVPAGTEVPRGTDVPVVVSLGVDLVSFPDISAATTFEEAKAILELEGFTVLLTFGDAQGAVRSYNIAGAVPEVGQQFRRGTQVDFEAL
ncbi:MAG TPA: PASTA domain-containing protein [Ilumatobacter sp.]|nr:PASTA domain-containing protein [Ilumatobacter sp.]